MQNTIQVEATGELVTFLKSTTDTNGEYVEILVELKEGGKGPGPHIHHRQVETYTVQEGRVGVLLGKEKIELSAGQQLEIPAGTIHNYWSADGKPIKFTATIQPALNFEWMLREIFASCNRKRAAGPSPFDGSYVITKLRGEYSLADVPVFVQRFVFPVVAGLGKATGQLKISSEPYVKY
jgi:mannose-6-phosphate isomerase-like protein (cupin superfamily)